MAVSFGVNISLVWYRDRSRRDKEFGAGFPNQAQMRVGIELPSTEG